MERHEISTEKVDWPELVRHVARIRGVVELSEGQRPIAMSVPVERRRTMAYELLTTNTAEFRRVPNLRVIPYPSGISS